MVDGGHWWWMMVDYKNILCFIVVHTREPSCLYHPTWEVHSFLDPPSHHPISHHEHIDRSFPKALDTRWVTPQLGEIQRIELRPFAPHMGLAGDPTGWPWWWLTGAARWTCSSRRFSHWPIYVWVYYEHVDVYQHTYDTINYQSYMVSVCSGVCGLQAKNWFFNVLQYWMDGKT